MKYSWPSVSTGVHPWIQPNMEQNLKKIIPESSKKPNLNLPCMGNYLHSIHIVLGIMSNPEMDPPHMCIDCMQITCHFI